MTPECLVWRKSTRSGGNGCVEVAWTKSTYCPDGECVQVAWHGPCSDGNCVQIAKQGGAFLIRDTDDPTVVVRVRPQSWQAFLEGMKDGEFDQVGEP
jgi:hypothetical protein